VELLQLTSLYNEQMQYYVKTRIAPEKLEADVPQFFYLFYTDAVWKRVQSFKYCSISPYFQLRAYSLAVFFKENLTM